MSDGFVVKDSGERSSYDSGMVRDASVGKTRPDLISPFFEDRLGQLLRKGAEKYVERNWEKGQPFSRAFASLKRHVRDFQEGNRDEDHLAAVAFGCMAIIHYEEMIKRGLMDAALSDMPDYGAEVVDELH